MSLTVVTNNKNVTVAKLFNMQKLIRYTSGLVGSDRRLMCQNSDAPYFTKLSISK